MRRLLRSSKTGQYFCRGEWTTDVHSAQDFPDTLSAIETALQAQLLGVEMVLQIGPEPSAAYDISLPLQALAADLLPRPPETTSPSTPPIKRNGTKVTAPGEPSVSQPLAGQSNPSPSQADPEAPMARS